jgi:hypothetical protein
MNRPSSAPVSGATAGWPLMERAILPSVLGLPGYAAIGIALGFTGLGVFIDLERINGLGTVFKGCYFLGCVLAVCWVKRRALFGPMVQPPMLLALAVPGVVLASGDVGSRGGKAAQLLAIATPLLNGFPTMAVTTAFVLVIGIIRYRTQRPSQEPEPVRAARPVPLRDEDDPDRADRRAQAAAKDDEPSLAARLERKEREQSGPEAADGAREKPARKPTEGTGGQPARKASVPPETDAERTEQQERPADPPRELRPQQGQPRSPDRRPPPGQRPADQRAADDDEPTSQLPRSDDAAEPVGAQPGRPPAGKPPAGRGTPPGRPPAAPRRP